jgi:hypothetical protein
VSRPPPCWRPGREGGRQGGREGGQGWVSIRFGKWLKDACTDQKHKHSGTMRGRHTPHPPSLPPSPPLAFSATAVGSSSFLPPPPPPRAPRLLLLPPGIFLSFVYNVRCGFACERPCFCVCVRAGVDESAAAGGKPFNRAASFGFPLPLLPDARRDQMEESEGVSRWRDCAVMVRKVSNTSTPTQREGIAQSRPSTSEEASIIIILRKYHPLFWKQVRGHPAFVVCVCAWLCCVRGRRSLRRCDKGARAGMHIWRCLASPFDTQSCPTHGVRTVKI